MKCLERRKSAALGEGKDDRTGLPPNALNNGIVNPLLLMLIP